jgi:hypothetical protein
MIFWLYIDEYCSSQWITSYCAIIQHLTPEIFLNPEGSFFFFETNSIIHFEISGQITVNMYGYLYDFKGTSARTFASIPKKDWCRFAFIVNEYIVISNLLENLLSIVFCCYLTVEHLHQLSSNLGSTNQSNTIVSKSVLFLFVRKFSILVRRFIIIFRMNSER